MKTLFFTVCAAVSFAVGVLFLAYALYVYKKGKRAKRVLSAIQLYTIGTFLSVVLIFIPIYYTDYDFGDTYKFIRPLLLAVNNSFRVFILDGEFDIVVEAVKNQNIFLRVCFTLYAAFLYVLAPILTFSNVLSLFKNITEENRYKLHRYQKHYIMSELNEKSIALAKSIRKRQKDAVIVFTDVFEQNEEDDYELLTQARDINAICLKKDVSHLDFMSKKGDVEIFLIGNDESENVSQAVKITTKLNQKNCKHNVKVFVFSIKPSAAYIIDSIKYDNLLEYASNNNYGEKCFKLRRIDEKHQLIWNTVPKMKLFEIANRNDKKLSVLVVGFGTYGLEFFKMLVWYCQFEGYKLEINIVDKRGKKSGGKNYIESVINRDCPDLLKNNRSDADGDAQYDIRIFSGVDVLTSDFDEILLYEGTDTEKTKDATRLKSTNLAFVSLGDDDLNIEVAIYLRRLFDRVNNVDAKGNISWEDEKVDIYSIVYDDQKSGFVDSDNPMENESNMLVNHRDVPYHVHFIGSMSSQFDYQNIYNAELERSALEHHLGWADIEEKIYNDWKNKGRSDVDDYPWYFEDEKKPEAVANNKGRYEKYEYFRRSSIAKELYQREIKNNPTMLSQTKCLGDGSQTCECKNCIRRKKSEHMRWNAYTRGLGYVYKKDKKAYHRAFLHNDLCCWQDLSERDRQKD